MPDIPASGPPLFSARGIVKEFSGVRALNYVSFDVREGEVFGIAGLNGSGKTALAEVLTGVSRPGAGWVEMKGRRVSIPDAEAARALKIASIPQEITLVDELNVFENIFLGMELTRGPLLDKKEMRKRARELLDRFKAGISPDGAIGELSAAQKRLVEIARAVASKPRVLIMDEPASVLTSWETYRLFDVINEMKGAGVLYVSSNLRELKAICGRIAVMREGGLSPAVRAVDLDINEARKLMSGTASLPTPTPPPRALPQGSQVVLEVKELSADGFFTGVSFSLRKGEILGLFGLPGAGRTELAETLMGLRRKRSGSVKINGTELDHGSPARAMKSGLAYLSEDRRGKGIIPDFGIVQNVTLASLDNYCSGFFVDQDAEYLRADGCVEELGIQTESLYTKLKFFSGGDQQKISLAKSLDTGPEVLILDEPTRGVGSDARRCLHRFIRKLADRGLSCILISSETEEIIAMCDRVAVMRGGRVGGVLEGDGVNEEELMFHATGRGPVGENWVIGHD
jgi:ribose transport system ATP-binding protein